MSNYGTIIRVWRDTPKPGETDAKWCAILSVDGNVVSIATNFETEEEAWEAYALDD